MKKSILIFQALLHSVGVFLYTSGVACLLFNGEKLFGKAQNFWMPAALLLLFVFSAAITGLLVFGRPAHLYFKGLKSEAIELLIYTLIFLFVITLIVLAVNVFI